MPWAQASLLSSLKYLHPGVHLCALQFEDSAREKGELDDLRRKKSTDGRRFIPGPQIEPKWGVRASLPLFCLGAAVWDSPVVENQHGTGGIVGGPASAIVVGQRTAPLEEADSVDIRYWNNGQHFGLQLKLVPLLQQCQQCLAEKPLAAAVATME